MWEMFVDMFRSSTAFKALVLLVVGGAVAAAVLTIHNQKAPDPQPPPNLVQQVLPNVLPAVANAQVNNAAQQAQQQVSNVAQQAQQQAQPMLDKAKMTANDMLDKANRAAADAQRQLQQYNTPPGGVQQPAGPQPGAGAAPP